MFAHKSPWYQYHGGTNFGRSAGGPFVITSYDYDAPIDEYGTSHFLMLEAELKKLAFDFDFYDTQVWSGNQNMDTSESFTGP